MQFLRASIKKFEQILVSLYHFRQSENILLYRYQYIQSVDRMDIFLLFAKDPIFPVHLVYTGVFFHVLLFQFSFLT